MVTQIKGVDPRAKRTRQLLQQAVLELLREKHFASITVQDITEQAMVNRATLYAHYADKYHLLDAVIRERFQHEVASQLLTVSRGGVRTLHVLIGAVFDFLSKVQNEHQSTDKEVDTLFEHIVQEELSELLESWLKQVPASGTEQRIQRGTMASVISWVIFGAAVQWSSGKGTITAEEAVTQVLIVLTEGLARLMPALVLR